MPIMRPTLPPDVMASCSAELSKFVAAPAGCNERYVGAPPQLPTMADLGLSPGDPLHDAQQRFVLRLADAAAGDLNAVVPSGWRVFAGTTPGPVLMGKVMSGPPPAGWRMTAAYHGDRAGAVLQASLDLDARPEVSSGNYELRVLAVPALNLQAFWLADQGGGGHDWVVPFPAAPQQPIDVLNTQPIYSMADFLAAIRPLAGQRVSEPLLHAR